MCRLFASNRIACCQEAVLEAQSLSNGWRFLRMPQQITVSLRLHAPTARIFGLRAATNRAKKARSRELPAFDSRVRRRSDQSLSLVQQEDGLRVGLGDDLAPPPPPRTPRPPLHVAIVGGLCGSAGLIFTLLGVIQSTRSESSMQNYGWLVLALVSGFGIYACVQFIRGQSVKLLMLALAL
jgi:hypothetical protein